MTRDEQQAFLQKKYPSQTVKYIGHGTDSTAFRVGTRVFRFPHYDTSIYDKEIAVCDFVRDSVSVPIPKIEVIRDGDIFCAAHDMIMGGKWSWHKFQFHPVRQRRLADSAAKFLAELHGCDATHAMKKIPGLQEQIPFCDFDEISDFLAGFMSPRQMRVFRRNYERIVGTPIAPRDMVIVHMGLKGANSVVDKSGALCGVFDFGSAGVYERWRDLELFYLGKNKALYRRMRKMYAKYSGVPVPRGRIEDLAVVEFLWRKRLFPTGEFAPRGDHFIMRNISAALARFYHLPRGLHWLIYWGLKRRRRRNLRKQA